MCNNNTDRLVLAMIDKKQQIPFYIKIDEAENYNKTQHGIFKTINNYSYDKPRKIETCKKILAWAIDIDKGQKDEQIKKITKANIEPSTVIESKNGFHIYWNCFGDTNNNQYSEIVEKRLIPYFDADIKAKDVSRFLRMEGFYHWKDINDPYIVKVIYHNKNIKYTFKNMLEKLDKIYTQKINKHKYIEFYSRSNRNVRALDIYNKLGGVILSNNSYRVHCPNPHKHKNGDKNPSLDIKQLPDKILFHCWSACSQEEVLSALIKEDLW
jgi:hypothetical protein